MRLTRVVPCVGVVVLCLLGVCPAVDTTQIEAVRAKSVLDATDLKAIDDFVTAGVQELIATQDFTSISSIRGILAAYSTGSQVQYVQQYSESALKHIAGGIKQADQLTIPEHVFRVKLNLLMLADSLQDAKLVDVALSCVNDKSEAVRYWAVHLVTNEGLLEKIKSGQGVDIQRRIATELKKVVEASGPETMALIIDFAGKSQSVEAESLLAAIADARIKAYADWTVESEVIDASILTALARQMKGANPGKIEAGRRFGQLLSYVIQRYVSGRDILDQQQKEHLVSSIVDAEKNCIPELTGRPQSALRRAIEMNDMAALQQEHNRLLGDGTQAGLLPSTHGFDYGAGTNGGKLLSPKTLPPPAAKQ